MNHKRFAWPLALCVVAAIIAVVISTTPAASQPQASPDVPLTTVGRIGGLAGSVAIANGLIYLGESGSLTILAPQPSLQYRVLGKVTLPSHIVDIEVVGNVAYLAVTNAGLYIVDVANPQQPAILAHVSDLGSTSYVTVEGSFAYVGSIYTGLYIIDVHAPAKPRRVGEYIDTFPDYYGWRSFQVANGIAYLLTSYGDRTKSVHIVDVRNPAVPKLLANVGSRGKTTGYRVWHFITQPCM